MNTTWPFNRQGQRDVLNLKNQHGDFLIAHQAVLHQALQTLKDDLHSSYSILLGPIFINLSIPYAFPSISGWRVTTLHYSS